MKVEAAYALPAQQWLACVDVAEGTTAREVVQIAVDAGKLPALDVAAHELGVFGRKVAPDYIPQAGERVEVYRPLTADPKEVRRQLAAAGKTMGKRY